MKVGTPPRTFQELIFALQRYWSDQGCVILQPADMEMGAGTFHAATFLRAIGPEAAGARRTCSPPAGPPTVATAITRFASSTTTSSRSSSSRRR